MKRDLFTFADWRDCVDGVVLIGLPTVVLVWMALMLLLIVGCAPKVSRKEPEVSRKVSPRAPALNYMIPEELKDTDTICVPYNGGGLCKRVKDVRAFVASRSVEP